jgi:hypothetical protein
MTAMRAPEHRAQVVSHHHAAHVVRQQREHVHAKHNLRQQQQRRLMRATTLLATSVTGMSCK